MKQQPILSNSKNSYESLSGNDADSSEAMFKIKTTRRSAEVPISKASEIKFTDKITAENNNKDKNRCIIF